jgi:acyl dehydratase
VTVVDARIGDRLPLRHVVVEAARMATMSALMDDPVPIHYDPQAVRALGLGDRLINQGPMAFGYLTETVVAWTGDVRAVAALRCRFHANVFDGDRLVCSGTVIGRDGDGHWTLELAIHRGDELVVSGGARVRPADGGAGAA